MKIAAIRKAAEKITKRYGMPAPIVEKANGNPDGKSGYNGVQIRSELTLDEGGMELSAAIEKIDPAYICESQGGCVYFVYRP